MASYYSVIQFYPDGFRGERINIGVVAIDKESAYCRFLEKWERVVVFNCGKDIDSIHNFREYFLADCLPNLTMDTFQDMRKVWQHSIKFAELRASLLPANRLIDQVSPKFLVEGLP